MFEKLVKIVGDAIRQTVESMRPKVLVPVKIKSDRKLPR